MLRAPGNKMGLGTFVYEVKVEMSSKMHMVDIVVQSYNGSKLEG